MPKLFFSLLISTSFSYSECLEMYETHQSGGGIDVPEYVYGEDNCCDEFPISFCNEGTVYYQKDDYADPTDSDNWDIISDDIALIRGDNQMIYNPITENSYISGSPSNTLWRALPSYSVNSDYYAAGVLAIIYVPKYLPGTVGSIYSIPDNKYYDINFISWTSGNGQGWPGGGSDGSGGGGGGGVSYWRSGPIDPSPNIISVLDISDDQGGRVYVEIKRSMIDIAVHPIGIDNYTIQRFDEPNWVNLGSFGGVGEKVYYYEALTLSDSSYQDSGITGFRVIAQNYFNDYSFMSEIVYGYSVDNLAPDSPENFNFAFNENILQLTWDPVFNGDFDHYEIDKSADILFETDQYGSVITSGTSYIDLEYIEGETVYYRISALDHAGNRGAYSQTLTVSSSLNVGNFNNIPTKFKLHQNYPNPFNPTTKISYDLPNESLVTLLIYDLMGRKVRTLINSEQTVGFKNIQWNATDDNGQPVPAGMYIYTIQAGEFRQTRKMVLLK